MSPRDGAGSAARDAVEPMNASDDRAASAAGDVVLALNSGSSSLKFGLYRVHGTDATPVQTLLDGALDDVSHVSDIGDVSNMSDAVARIAARLAQAGLPAPVAVGHRVVHGGPTLRAHSVIDADVLRELGAARAFAPLHTPPMLALVRAARERFADVPHVACLDTAFHARMPDVASTFAIDLAMQTHGIRRYGFHGLSCESVVHQLAGELPPRLVIAHLGNGASISAVKDGRSIDTTMGLTPTGGVMMGTRSGDLDPGLLLYLMRERGFDASKLEDLLDSQSGLRGVSGLASDMRVLHAAAAHDVHADLAIRMFCIGVGKAIAGMGAVLGGIDALVFTGGIGEHDAATRAEICGALGWAGIGLDVDRNANGERVIGASALPCAVLVLASLEDEQIARHARALKEG